MEEFKAGTDELNNYYEKQSNKIEAYLLRIITRYFDTQNLNNKIFINSCITEAMMRYKFSIDYEDKGVRSINGKEGIVSLSMLQMGIEELQHHNTAFNKNFGTSYNTICEGNDSRLSDKREPTTHSHYIKDINGIEDKLNDIERDTILNKPIYHTNREILDLLYMENPDLESVDLDDLNNAVYLMNQKFKQVTLKEMEFKNLYTKYNNTLNQLLAELRRLKGIK